MSEWSGRKVLVTGAGGFIGSHLVEALAAQGAAVRAFVRYNSRSDVGLLSLLPTDLQSTLEVLHGDITDPWSVDQAVKGVEVVFHLAALIAIPYSYQAPESYVSTNINGTLNVLQAARRWGVPRVVHTSTSEAYGTAQYAPIDEEHPLQPQSPYSACKIGADCLADSFYRSFNTPVATIRPFNTYGPRQSPRAVIPTIVLQALAGLPELTLGALEPVRDFNYVTDTVAGFLAVASAEACIGTVVNVGSGVGISVGDVAEKILSLCGRSDMPIRCDQQRIRPEKSEVHKLVADSSKAKKLCGWEPRQSLEDGLTQTIRFLESRVHLYRAERFFT